MQSMTSWYPISAMRRLNKAVRVRWGWVEPFEAVLLSANPRRWATLRRDVTTGEIVTIDLPPKSVKQWRRTWAGELGAVSDAWLAQRGWGPEPQAWQPIGQWPDPLPDPLPTGEVEDTVRMASIGEVKFDAAAAAAEMEADRERARNGREPRDRSEGLAWWWSPAEVVYEPAGMVSRRMAEGRVMRAVAWCRGGHASPKLASSKFFAEMAAAASELFEEVDVASQAVRFVPLQEDLGDFLTAMGWFVRLNSQRTEGIKRSREQEMLLLRSLPVPPSFGEIGRRLGVSSQRAHQLYQRAVDKVTALANQPEGIDAPIAKLRERNRAARVTSS
jgi:hypothetical protein